MGKGHGVSGHTHTQAQLNNYANQNNPNNSAYQANRDNHANQCNPNNDAYKNSRDSGRNNLFKENSFASAVGFSLFIDIFSLRPRVIRSCFLVQPRAILARRMCLHRRRINCAPMEHHFYFCTDGAQVKDETSPPAEEKLPTSHPPARKFNLCASSAQGFVICLGRRLACATALAARTISAVCF